jgi:predicted secreted protein
MPTFVHGIDCDLSIGGTAIEGTLTSASMDLSRALAEIKSMGAGQVTRVAGLKDVTFTAGGDYDATIDAALFAAWDGSAVVAVILEPNGTITYTVNCWVASYNISASSDGQVTYTVNLSGSGDVARA